MGRLPPPRAPGYKRHHHIPNPVNALAGEADPAQLRKRAKAQGRLLLTLLFVSLIGPIVGLWSMTAHDAMAANHAWLVLMIVGCGNYLTLALAMEPSGEGHGG